MKRTLSAILLFLLVRPAFAADKWQSIRFKNFQLVGNASESEIRRAVNLGCYFSVNFEMTRTARGRAVLERLPLERVLTETDGPFTKVHGKPTQPQDVVNVVSLLAHIRNTKPAAIAKQMTLNLGELLQDTQ